MTPPLERIIPYVDNRKLCAETFGVSERTVIRWFQRHGLYEPKKNYGCGKLNRSKATEIRRLHTDGASIRELADSFGVTFAAVSRIINNLTYREPKMHAHVTVIYNPEGGPGGFRGS